MSIRESTVEKAVCQWAKEHGILVMKLAGPQQKGQPDRMFLYQGRACFMEIKAPGKKPTALQQKWLQDLWDRGFSAHWFDTSSDAIRFLKSVFSV